MSQEIQSFQSEVADHKAIYYHHWPSQGSARGQLLIAHGMAEHGKRYARFAQFLNKAGFGVWAIDHRGHGLTAGKAAVGYFEDGDFWQKAQQDLSTLLLHIKKDPALPVFFLGHSMGSLLGRDFILKNAQHLNGAIFSGTAGDPGFLGKIGMLIAKMEAFFKGRKKLSPLLNQLSFGQFNQPFKPNRTDFDWLSRDDKEVDKYINDPICGTVFTTGFFIDLLKGVNKINHTKTYQATDKAFPILLIAGDMDPVGDMGKGVKEVYSKYQKASLQDVTCKLYHNARHEILNETNRIEVMEEIIQWINKRV